MHPILFSTPYFNVYSYGLMVALGYTAGTAWILHLAKKENLPVEPVFDMLLIQLVVGVLGSRFLYLVEYEGLFSGKAGFFDFEKGGLTFYGAVISSIVFDVLFLRYKGLPFWQVMDCTGNGLTLGIVIARLGCFLNGCCHGVPCTWPWGVVFPRVSQIPLHPTQIYESFSALLIFIFLQKWWPRRKNYGQGLVMALCLYAVFRFTIEFWRGDNPIYSFGLTLSQVVSIVVLVCGAVFWKVIDRSPSLRIFPQK